MWVVYRRPRDLPGVEWCVRRWRARPGFPELQPDALAFPAASLEAARALLPPGLTRLAREPGDDPVIVETWL